MISNLRDTVEMTVAGARAYAADLDADDRAQSRGGSLAGLMIGILIAGIIAINVFIPVINDAIAQSNVSGTTKTILDLLGLFAALLVLVALAGPLMGRVR